MLYAKYQGFDRAKATLDVALQALPEPPWKIMREADVQDAYGDPYVDWGRPDEARPYYERAVQLYPTAKPTYGGHLLPRRAAKVQAERDLQAFESLATTRSGTGTPRL